MTVSEIVRKDYRTAEVFNKYGINFCCSANLPLQQACLQNDIDPNLVQNDLDKAANAIYLPPTVKFEDWSVEFMVDYILNIHHTYIKQTVPELNRALRSFVSTHKDKYSYIFFVEEAFNDLATEVLEHMEHEEESIFPYVKLVSTTNKRKETYGSLFVRTLSKPLSLIIESEHKRIESLLKQLRKTTNNYTFSNDVCPIHQVIYNKLKEFDVDLVQHKGLEDRILFPRAIAMEQELLLNV
jgi:regulator of cell morphogenesis and NO signaling